VRGVFATAAIEPGTLLLEIPWGIVVTAPIEAKRGARCSSIASIRAYLARAPLEPYRKLLLNSAPNLPFAWPAEVQARLRALLGTNLPPLELGHRHAWWVRCGGAYDASNGDALSDMALQLAVARAAAIRNWSPPSGAADERATWLTLLPLYDLYNHRNGAWHNTRVVGSVGQPLQMFAYRRISAGEELYLTYGSGSDRLFDDYGFVEELPQRWAFRTIPHPASQQASPLTSEPKGVVTFDVDASDASALASAGEPPRVLKVTWRSGVPSHAQRSALARELGELQARMNALVASSASERVADERLDLAWRYAEAMERALSAAVTAADTDTRSSSEFPFLRAFNVVLGAALCWKVFQLAQIRAEREHAA
jgi:hypothetical protein